MIPLEGSLAIYGSMSAVNKLLTPLGLFSWKSVKLIDSDSGALIKVLQHQQVHLRPVYGFPRPDCCEFLTRKKEGAGSMRFIQLEPKQAAREIASEANTIYITVNDVTTVLEDRLSSRIKRYFRGAAQHLITAISLMEAATFDLACAICYPMLKLFSSEVFLVSANFSILWR